MVMKINADKRVFRLLLIIVLAMLLPINVTYNGVPLLIFNLFVSLCIVTAFTANTGTRILEKAYGYKSEWFEAQDMKAIETGKISRKVAFSIGKNVHKELDNQSNYSIIFSKGRKKLTEYNRTFEGSTLAEVSEYLDSVATQLKK